MTSFLNALGRLPEAASGIGMLAPMFLKSAQKLPVSFPLWAEASPAEGDDPPDDGALAAPGDDPPDEPQPASAAQDRMTAAAPGTAQRAVLLAGHVACSHELEVSR